MYDYEFLVDFRSISEISLIGFPVITFWLFFFSDYVGGLVSLVVFLILVTF